MTTVSTVLTRKTETFEQVPAGEEGSTYNIHVKGIARWYGLATDRT